MAEICLYGTNANIQKMALMGINKEVSEPFKRGYTSVPLVSAGLLDLAFFHATNEVRDGGNVIFLFILLLFYVSIDWIKFCYIQSNLY